MANAGTYNHTKQHFAEGAAAATPDAGEVVIYAKTDGLVYSKDDAGAETLMSSGAALSNPMTTAEDIIVGGASGTPARLAKGTDDQVLTMVAGAVAWAAAAGGLATGTSFPGAPTTGDRYRRSDIDYMVFFYDGTRWVSEQVFVTGAFEADAGLSATVNEITPIQTLGSRDLYFIDMETYLYVATTNNGSNYWAVKAQNGPTGSAYSNTLATESTAALSANTHYRLTESIAAAVTYANLATFRFRFEKTSSPGVLLASVSLRYRLIAT